jgi:hypothetical protein
MDEVKRISPVEARQRAQSGRALLVCAYENEELCRRNWLGGSISLRQLKAQVDQVDKNQELIFYCA